MAVLYQQSNRPLALRGHVTNASFKQWIGIFADAKNCQSTQKLSYTRNLRGNAFKGDSLWHFDFSAQQYGLYWPPCWRACSCPPTWRPNYVLLISCSTFHSYAQMCCKRYHIFSTFSLKFKCKICVQREVIHNFKNHILVT